MKFLLMDLINHERELLWFCDMFALTGLSWLHKISVSVILRGEMNWSLNKEVKLLWFIHTEPSLNVIHLFGIFCCFAGQCLNFNCMFILVLMLRQSITFLRTHGFSMILPLDQHIYFHKLTGVFIFIQSIVHTIMHLLNFSEYDFTGDSSC